MNRILSYLKFRFKKISEINQRYSKPRVQMTPFVKISLLFLRLYLLLLVIILVIKFITLLK